MNVLARTTALALLTGTFLVLLPASESSAQDSSVRAYSFVSPGIDAHLDALREGEWSARLEPFFGQIHRFSEKEMQSRRLAERIRRAEGDTSELEAELDELLEDIFNEKLEAQQERVEHLREEIARLEERIATRSEAREEIIRTRKNELLGHRDVYDW
jgi:peptidoglycan hydrolase CwlO-like protein